MNLANLQVSEIVLHEVFKRGVDPEAIPPEYGNILEALEPEALDAFHDRIITAMTRTSRCLQMALANVGAESMIARAISIAGAPDAAEFIKLSCGVADTLTREQKSRQIPGGILVVFRGTTGVPARRMVGVIKAEVLTGFTREGDSHGQRLKFLNKLMLTAQTKLYKMGLFVEESPFAVGDAHNQWEAFIYDETLTMGNREGAAKYFYDGFLGLKFPESSARQTKRFHEHTKSFIQSLGIDEDQKVVLFNALVTYLKADQTPTVSVAEFSDAYLAEDDLKDAYRAHMLAKEFPDAPVNKDLTDLQSSLRIRQLRFGSRVRISAPAEDFERLVQVRSIEGERDPNGITQQWTEVLVKDRISGQD